MIIEEIRKQAGMTRKQVSDLTGVPIRSLTNWELEVRKCPEYIERMVVEKIAAATKKAVVNSTPEGCIAVSIVHPDGSWYNDCKIPVTDGKISADILDRIQNLQKNGYNITFSL